ncbi:MAG: hypothetical protein HUJ61_02795 [Bacilli bacterium]|nr:hypothetical protein [Bacilli bacterium]
MAISNQLQVSFNHELINVQFDFFLISTSDKYISGGAYVLDKPIDKLKAESVVFDNGRTLFIMFKKNAISKFELIKELIDEKLTIKQISSDEIKDYILFKLCLYSVNNFEFDDNKFNNLAGKLYITKPKWMSKNHKTFKALNINVDPDLFLSAEAVTFTRVDCFNAKLINDYPKYTFSNKNACLKRTFDKEETDTYIRKSIYGKKAEIAFFDFSEKEITNNKVYYIYKVLAFVANKFSEYLSFSFKEIELTKSIGKMRDDDFISKSKEIILNKTINLINWSNASEYETEFTDIKDMLLSKGLSVSIGQKLDDSYFNLVYLHNKEFYEQNKYNDPYLNFKNSVVIQHITIEDSADKIVDDNDAIINTIIKEFVIKDDIINNKSISLDNWSELGFKGNVIFAKEKNDIVYILSISPDGRIELFNKLNNFSSFHNELLDKIAEYLIDSIGKDKYLIADDKKNIIMVSRTNRIILPSKELLTMETISRSKESREKYLSGVVDINLYEENDGFYYNVGIKGSGMNTKIVKASPIYKVEVLSGNNFIEGILETMAVPFVKYKSFTVVPYPFKYLNEYIEMTEKELKQKTR